MQSVRRLLRLPRMRKRRFVYLIIVSAIIFFIYQFGFISELSQAKKKEKSSDFPLHDRSFSKSNDKDHTVHSSKGQEQVIHHKTKVEHKSRKGQEQVIHHKTKVEHESRTHGSVFKCKASSKLISSDKVNDDYCDCPEDGADEFLTEACDNAVFYCKSSKSGYPSKIVSAWVNDGVCDCCDGSDEWQEKTLINLPLNLQEKVHRFVSPCPKLC